MVETDGATDPKLAVAKVALEIYAEIEGLKKRLDGKKDQLRKLANGDKMSLMVEGLGKVSVTKPRTGSEKKILMIDEERLKQSGGLRAKLIEKGVLREDVRVTSPADASVRLQLNV
jgi:hypothetical protein